KKKEKEGIKSVLVLRGDQVGGTKHRESRRLTRREHWDRKNHAGCPGSVARRSKSSSVENIRPLFSGGETGRERLVSSDETIRRRRRASAGEQTGEKQTSRVGPRRKSEQSEGTRKSVIFPAGLAHTFSHYSLRKRCIPLQPHSSLITNQKQLGGPSPPQSSSLPSPPPAHFPFVRQAIQR
ncbi:hypothetical protein K0M31_001674, partial [Melipona bicolor]